MTSAATGMISSEPLLSRRGGDNTLLSSGGRPLLVIVSGRDAGAMVDAGLEAVGGMGRVLGGHREVLLKPNTNQRDPFPSITAPETLRAVVRHCRTAGAQRVVVHEDHKNDPAPFYDAAELGGVEILTPDLADPSEFVAVAYNGWMKEDEAPDAIEDLRGNRSAERLKGYQREAGPVLRVARAIQQAPVVINLPVLKRHFAGQITSALKNHFGSVYGPQRWLGHASLGVRRDYFDRRLVEFASAVRPELTITDVRSLQPGSGPNRGEDTRIVEGVDRLILTGDMVAADVVAMALMKQYDPTFTGEHEAILRRQHQHAEALGLGSSDLSRFEIIELSV